MRGGMLVVPPVPVVIPVPAVPVLPATPPPVPVLPPRPVMMIPVPPAPVETPPSGSGICVQLPILHSWPPGQVTPSQPSTQLPGGLHT